MAKSVSRQSLYTVLGPKMLEEMSWFEVAEALKRTDIVLPVTGSVENHGPHSPLMVDCIQGVEVAKRAAAMLAAEGIQVVVGPLIPFGWAPHHMSFPGTITLRVTTYHELLKDVCRCLIRHGFRKLAVINGHGGNNASIALAVKEVYEETGALVVAPDWFPVLYDTYVKMAKSDRPEGEFHQGERATALTLAARPELMNMDRAEAVYSPEYERKKAAYGRGVNMAFQIDYDMKKVTPQGHIGNAKVATRELGEALYEEAAKFIATFIKTEFK